MTYTEIFEHNNKFYVIEKQKYETRESHMSRVWYILERINQCNDFDELIKLSIIWANTKKYNCQYSDNLMKQI